MDKRTNTPHDDFSVEEILQEARLLREQQGRRSPFLLQLPIRSQLRNAPRPRLWNRMPRPLRSSR